ncbi:MAG: hypothetical protein LBI19_08370 [Oscillospiraceae bacterium]|jgi:uncharacterized membrane protein YbhN (UPF0104 family)|nr:hypothetical protein [Oscillospiraceae bacterium]
MRSVIIILLLLIGSAGVIWLQIFLSKQESRWPGLVLPFSFISIFLFVAVALLLFSAFSSENVSAQTNQNSEAIGEVSRSLADDGQIRVQILLQVFNLFLLFILPTAVLFAIYAACRSSRKKKRALDKMSVQDLG